MAGFSQPSPLENILDKDDFTLEEVGAPARLASIKCIIFFAFCVTFKLCSRELCQALGY